MVNEEQNSSIDQRDFLIKKSEQLKGYLDDYINTLKKSKFDEIKTKKRNLDE